ncbi:MAG: hypothetical protein BWY11_02330 [Firmicutes bacterium ADurb.Bin182]|nr:MAG: hypothetical protein BWY11_02330 [Firmicutes bacterium ADurb.Bin182]
MEFLSGNSIWVYMFIFLGKIIEVTLSTLRVVLISRGERLAGSVIAFFDISLWILVTGTVLVGFQEDLMKCAVFAVAFALGNYIGSWLEGKLAFGLCSVQVIVNEDVETRNLIEILRKNDLAVTAVKGKGKDGDRELLILHIKRKRIKETVDLINRNLENALIVVSDSKVLRGGYIKK